MSEPEKTQAEEQDNRLSTDEEVEALQGQFVQMMRDGRARSNPYVAEPAPGHDVHGVWHCFGAAHRSGYATHAIALHWVLDRILGIPTQLVPHRHMDIDIDEFPKDRFDMLLDWNRKAVGHGHVLFSSFPPEVSYQLKSMVSYEGQRTGPRLVPYIAFEGTSVSDFARDTCNDRAAFAKVWVVHPFVRDALLAGGVEPDRIHVAPPMLFGGPWEGMHKHWAPGAYVPEGELQLLKPVTPDDPFTFGAMGTWHERKGFPDLVRAYFSAFRRDEPVQLVIRTSNFGKARTIREFKEFITEEIGAIAFEFGDRDFPASKKQPRIKLLLGTDATDADVIEWLGKLDCFVSPSYGEGLGIPHIWAKGQGVPLVSSSFGAVGELLSSIRDAGGTDDEIVPHEEVPVDPEMFKLALMFDRRSRWGGYKVEDLASAMRVQFERGRRTDLIGAGFVLDRHGEEAATRAVARGLEDLLGDEEQLLQDWGLRG